MVPCIAEYNPLDCTTGSHWRTVPCWGAPLKIARKSRLQRPVPSGPRGTQPGQAPHHDVRAAKATVGRGRLSDLGLLSAARRPGQERARRRAQPGATVEQPELPRLLAGMNATGQAVPIAEVEAIVLRVPAADATDLDGSSETILVRITDAQGRAGIGEADAPAGAVRELVLMDDVHAWSRGLRGVLLGRDPFDLRALYEDLYAATLYHGRGGARAGADGRRARLEPRAARRAARPRSLRSARALRGSVRGNALPWTARPGHPRALGGGHRAARPCRQAIGPAGLPVARRRTAAGDHALRHDLRRPRPRTQHRPDDGRHRRPLRARPGARFPRREDGGAVRGPGLGPRDGRLYPRRAAPPGPRHHHDARLRLSLVRLARRALGAQPGCGRRHLLRRGDPATRRPGRPCAVGAAGGNPHLRCRVRRHRLRVSRVAA